MVYNNKENGRDIDKVPATAIVFENGNALVFDFLGKINSSNNNYYSFFDINGDDLYIATNSLIIIDGEDSHEKALELAEKMVGVIGQVVEYKDIKPKTKTIGKR